MNCEKIITMCISLCIFVGTSAPAEAAYVCACQTYPDGQVICKNTRGVPVPADGCSGAPAPAAPTPLPKEIDHIMCVMTSIGVYLCKYETGIYMCTEFANDTCVALDDFVPSYVFEYWCEKGGSGHAITVFEVVGDNGELLYCAIEPRHLEPIGCWPRADGIDNPPPDIEKRLCNGIKGGDKFRQKPRVQPRGQPAPSTRPWPMDICASENSDFESCRQCCFDKGYMYGPEQGRQWTTGCISACANTYAH